MKHACRALFLVALIVGLAGCGDEELPPPQSTTEAVARHIEPLLKKKINAAAVALIVDGQVEQYYFGEARPGQAPDDETFWEIGSISKVFTSTLLALLSNEGALALDDPIQPVLAAAGVTTENLPPITFAQLAQHTAGLPRLPGNIAPADPSNPYADYAVEDMYAWLATGKSDRTPGEESVYSNFGVGLLGHLLALKQGRPYEDFARERLLTPLKMSHTAIALSDGQKARLALPHAHKNKVVSNWDIPTLAGAGGWRSTLPDMAAFLKAAMGDAPAPLDQAFALAVKPRFKIQDGVQIGLCWMITDSSVAGSPPLVWHNGQTGGYASFLGFRQDGRLGIVVLCNTASDAVDQAAVDIMRDVAAMGE